MTGHHISVPDPVFARAFREMSKGGEYRQEGHGYPAGVPVYGPPAAADGYRQRNIQAVRTRIFEAKRDRADAQRDGDERMVRVLSDMIDGWHRSLADLGVGANPESRHA